jgi:hypothetical protein
MYLPSPKEAVNVFRLPFYCSKVWQRACLPLNQKLHRLALIIVTFAISKRRCWTSLVRIPRLSLAFARWLIWQDDTMLQRVGDSSQLWE